MKTACILFDLDGTLCDTTDVDDECYRQAVARILGHDVHEIDWTRAPHRTDSGIARWLWNKHRGRPPIPEEIAAVRQEFFERLGLERMRSPHRFASIAGAGGFLETCLSGGLRVGIGTGGWRPSAALKLEAAGLPVELLFATSDDAETRAEIFSLAKKQALAGGVDTPVLLIGDSDCDAATARYFGWAFVGIGSETSVPRLDGASCILRDFRSVDLQMLSRIACEAR